MSSLSCEQTQRSNPATRVPLLTPKEADCDRNKDSKESSKSHLSMTSVFHVAPRIMLDIILERAA